jgi:stage V sporulation protein D (sporulation-specific penicillin-binding protein)
MRKSIFNHKIIKKLEKLNRLYYIAAFFVIFSLIIVQKLFSNTVIDHDFYQAKADKQQIWKVTVPVTRGTVYSATNGWTILGTSLNLFDIAIDPQISGSKVKLQEFLTNVVYKESCENVSNKICYNNILKFLKVIELEEFDYDENYIKQIIWETLYKKVNQEYVTSVFIDRELEQDKIDLIKSFWYAGIYPTFPYLYINPEEITQIKTVANSLAPLLAIDSEDLEYLMRKRKIQYVPILSKLSISVSEYVRMFLEEENNAMKKWLIKKEDSVWGFIVLTPRPQRYYPEKDVASQIIWFVDNEGKWHYGIEWYFNDSLKGNNGKIVSRKDIRWRIINPIELEEQNENTEWVKIFTSIDRNIQKKVETILEKWVKEFRANKGTVVVMEPKTGRVLSMANYPTFNLNDFSDVYELEKVRFSKYPDPTIDLLWYPVFVEDTENGERFFYDNKELFLRKATREELWENLLVKYKYKNDYGPEVYKSDAISSLYEPGSIMKALVFAMWIDTWEIEANELYRDINELQVWTFTIKNLDTKNCWGLHSFSNALDFSCNVWMVRIVQRLGTLLVYNYFQKFGFDDVTGITLEWEVTGQMRDWEKWSKSQLYTSSYGLGISVTPLQMAAAYSVLANGWVYYTPTVVDKVEFADGKVIKYKSEPQRRVIKESTSDIMTKILVHWVREWAAKRWAVEWYNLAGKTWTSQIPFRWKYETWQASTMASFAGYWPAEDPQFVIIVKLERPRTTNYWGASSAHLFREISEYLLDVYNIPKRK